MPRQFLAVCLATLALAGCHTERAILRNLDPDAPAAEYTIRIPDGYDVRSAGFGAAYATSVSGGVDVNGISQPVSGSSYQQPYVHVYAVERATGQEVLLVFGDMRRRADPVAIVRLERGGALRVGP